MNKSTATRKQAQEDQASPKSRKEFIQWFVEEQQLGTLRTASSYFYRVYKPAMTADESEESEESEQ